MESKKQNIILHKGTLNGSKNKFWMAFVACFKSLQWLKCEDLFFFFPDYLKMLVAIIQVNVYKPSNE